MLITLLKGIIIGLIISAPLGPVGILCLRETLYGGKREGLLTGVGAMLSDVLYGFVVYLGVGLVLDFIQRYDDLLRIVGGVIIIVFAVILYRNADQPMKDTPTRRLSKLHGFRKVVTAFFVTVANPFIMPLILPLYTRFRFVQAEGFSWELVIGLLGLGVGCMMWWYLLTSVVSWIANRTGHAGLRIISRVIAIVLGLLGLVGVYTGLESFYVKQSYHTQKFEEVKNSIENFNTLMRL